jgi:hypothetical protein
MAMRRARGRSNDRRRRVTVALLSDRTNRRFCWAQRTQMRVKAAERRTSPIFAALQSSADPVVFFQSATKN